MDIFPRGRRGERILLLPSPLAPEGVRWFEPKSDNDEILLDNRELVDRGLFGSCGSGSCGGRCGGSGPEEGSSRTREDRSVNGLLMVLFGDCMLFWWRFWWWWWW